MMTIAAQKTVIPMAGVIVGSQKAIRLVAAVFPGLSALHRTPLGSSPARTISAGIVTAIVYAKSHPTTIAVVSLAIGNEQWLVRRVRRKLTRCTERSAG